MRVLLVDDHRLFRDGMKSLLAQWRKDITIVEVGRLGDALEALGAGQGFDLILLDLTLPDSLEPQHTMGAVLAAADAAPVVAVTMLDRHPGLRHTVQAGARGFIRKTDSAQVMMATLEMVLAGGSAIPADLLNEPSPLSRPEAPLSERQLDVLRLIAKGLSNKEIARALGIAEATVKVHVHRILQLIDMPSRSKAAAWAHEVGLVGPEDLSATDSR